MNDVTKPYKRERRDTGKKIYRYGRAVSTATVSLYKFEVDFLKKHPEYSVTGLVALIIEKLIEEEKEKDGLINFKGY